MNTQRVAAFALAFAIVGLIFSFGYTRADTLTGQLPAETPKLDAPIPAGDWSIKLLLIIDGKIARSIDYNDKTFGTSEECKSAVIADAPLQASMQAVAGEVAAQFGDKAVVGIACAMKLD